MPIKHSEFESYLMNLDVVKFNRFYDRKSGDIRGIIVKVSQKYVLIKGVYDFRFDGFHVLRKVDIESIEWGDFQIKTREILFKEGRLLELENDTTLIDDLDIESWKAIFNGLKEKDLHVIVENENNKNSFFLIGKIDEAKKKEMSIWYYDPLGVVDEKPTVVKYEEITFVSFGDHYSTTLRKYLARKKLE